MTADPHPYALIEADDSVLIVIDVQDAFRDKLPLPDAELVLNRVCWLVKLAMWQEVPLVVTAEAAHEQPLVGRHGSASGAGRKLPLKSEIASMTPSRPPPNASTGPWPIAVIRRIWGRWPQAGGGWLGACSEIPPAPRKDTYDLADLLQRL